MKSRNFSNNTEQECKEIFQDYVDRDLESFFSSTIAFCSSCKDEFEELWPATVLHDEELQFGYQTVDEFINQSRIQDDWDKHEIKHYRTFLRCPNCEQPLDNEMWIFEHSFDVPDDFFISLREIASLAATTPFLLLNHPFAKRVFDTVVELGGTCSAQLVADSVFSARRAEDIEAPTLVDFGAPPANRVQEGRYNHAAHPMLYVAYEQQTAFSEVATENVRFLIAELHLSQPLKILDLRIRQEADTDNEMLLHSLARSALCSAPRTGEGWQKREYVFSRFVADCARHAGFDAILFGSTKLATGSNLVILRPPQKIADIATLVSISRLP